MIILVLEPTHVSLALMRDKKIEKFIRHPLTHHEIGQLKIFNPTKIYNLIQGFIGDNKHNKIIIVVASEGLYEIITDKLPTAENFAGYLTDAYRYGDNHWYIAAVKREIVAQWHILMSKLKVTQVTITTRTLVFAYQTVPEVMTLEELQQTQAAYSTENLLQKLVTIY